MTKRSLGLPPARPPTEFGFSLTDLDERDLFDSKLFQFLQLVSKMHDAVTVDNTGMNVTLSLTGQVLSAQADLSSVKVGLDGGRVTDTNVMKPTRIIDLGGV